MLPGEDAEFPAKTFMLPALFMLASPVVVLIPPALNNELAVATLIKPVDPITA